MVTALVSRAAAAGAIRVAVPLLKRNPHMLPIQSLIAILVIGLIAGWSAGKLMKGGGFGLTGNLVVGIIGSFIGSFLWNAVPHVPVVTSIKVTDIVSATVGAVVLLFVLRLIKR
jgi:uncharacterized membrane protein YeaQ/YmgE (transglycosylase-associated protein family)